VETQAGKGISGWEEPLNFGTPGVTGSDCGNKLAAEADVVLAVGSRLQDFTTGSWTIFRRPGRRIIALNVAGYDAAKRGSQALVADAKVGLERLSAGLGAHRFADPDFAAREAWFATTGALMAAPAGNALPTDAQVVGAVNRSATGKTVVMGAAGSMPGVLHVLWRGATGGYHMEYGFSCMGYEVAGALGIKMAQPDREVICMVGDGSYMMANSELATAAMMGVPFTVVLTDNRGFGCINRLQKHTGGAPFNNLLDDSFHVTPSAIDFVAHAGSMGAEAVKVDGIAALEAALAAPAPAGRPRVIVIDSDPGPGTGAGGSWWQVGVPEVSLRPTVEAAHREFADGQRAQWLVS
jgi:3D-(3,5/4)-trihydroxycyclohexane-1,2-dione acylhydrolase (decyclizing)